MSATLTSPILSDLRSGTAQSHENLEAQIGIDELCQNVGSYRKLLEDFYGFYVPIEAHLQSIEGWDAHGFSWTERTKIEMLRSDLRALGLTPAAIDALPVCQETPRPSTLEGAFGCAYVLEGSTLGGRSITAILDRSGIPTGARSFFASYGEAVGQKWREFCAMLQALDPSESPTVVREAAATFDAMAAWLARKE